MYCLTAAASHSRRLRESTGYGRPTAHRQPCNNNDILFILQSCSDADYLHLQWTWTDPLQRTYWIVPNKHQTTTKKQARYLKTKTETHASTGGAETDDASTIGAEADDASTIDGTDVASSGAEIGMRWNYPSKWKTQIRAIVKYHDSAIIRTSALRDLWVFYRSFQNLVFFFFFFF